MIDDERSISRHSRYAADCYRIHDLRSDEADGEGSSRRLRERRDVEGWVVYPTREETVAALARHRARLSEHFRIPTPDWAVTQWAWDKRNTYARAAELGIPVPRCWHVSTEEELDAVDGDPPYVIKPAIKEHFFYATKCKAWRADTRAELALRFRAAAALVGTDEVVIQELIPGDGDTQLAYCAFFKDEAPLASMVVNRLRQHPVEFGRASTFVRTVDIPEVEEMSVGFCARSATTASSSSSTSTTCATDRPSSWTSTRGPGATTAWASAPAWIFPTSCMPIRSGSRFPAESEAQPGISWIRLATDLPTAAGELARRRLDWRAYLRSLRVFDVESVFTPDDPRPGFAELALLPYLAIKRGI